MPKTTQQTKQNYTNTASYDQIHPESNAYIDRFANFEPSVDPTIGYRAGSAKRQLNNSFINPLGGYSTPQRDEAIRRSTSRQIDEDAAMQSRAGMYDVNQQKMGQLGSLASLMSPRIVQTGSSGNSQSNSEQGKNAWGNALDIGMGMASIF